VKKGLREKTTVGFSRRKYTSTSGIRQSGIVARAAAAAAVLLLSAWLEGG
jgi:hypothetical protein